MDTEAEYACAQAEMAFSKASQDENLREHPRYKYQVGVSSEDLPVNPTKAKHVTNHRAAGSDKTEALTPPLRFSLERAIEYIAPDELVEATPENIRLRKRILDSNERRKAVKRAAAPSE